MLDPAPLSPIMETVGVMDGLPDADDEPSSRESERVGLLHAEVVTLLLIKRSVKDAEAVTQELWQFELKPLAVYDGVMERVSERLKLGEDDPCRAMVPVNVFLSREADGLPEVTPLLVTVKHDEAVPVSREL